MSNVAGGLAVVVVVGFAVVVVGRAVVVVGRAVVVLGRRVVVVVRRTVLVVLRTVVVVRRVVEVVRLLDTLGVLPAAGTHADAASIKVTIAPSSRPTFRRRFVGLVVACILGPFTLRREMPTDRMAR